MLRVSRIFALLSFAAFYAPAGAFATVDCGCGLVFTDSRVVDSTGVVTNTTYVPKRHKTGKDQNGNPIYTPLTCSACDDLNTCEFTEYWAIFVNGRLFDSGTIDHKKTCPKVKPAKPAKGAGVTGGMNYFIPREFNELGMTEDFLRGVVE